jgi:DNA-binding SARP family transcriptional activator
MHHVPTQVEPPSAHLPALRLLTFGPFTLLCHGTPLTDKWLAGSTTPATLLKVLLCAGPAMDSHRRPARSGLAWERHEMSLDALIEAIWSEEEQPEDAPAALAVAKSRLNQVVQQAVNDPQRELILRIGRTDEASYALNLEMVSIDADEFEATIFAATQAEDRGEDALPLWEQAFGLVQGDFLPQDRYADWAQARRERLQARYRHCLYHLTARYAQQGRINKALSLIHPYVIAHPADQDALCLLVPLLAEQRRYDEALRCAERYEQDVREYGEEPAASVTALAEAIRQQQDAHVLRTAQSLLAASSPSVVSSAQMIVVASEPTVKLLASTPDARQERPQPARWFDSKRASIAILIEQWQGRATHCDELESLIHQELSMFDRVQSLYAPETHRLSRREALAALLALPPALLAAVQEPLPPAMVLEEFLPRCTASITACQHLMRGQEFFTVEQTLAEYLPIVEMLARQPSHYQQAAARLAAQGRRFLAVLAHHRLDIEQKILHYKKAVDYSRLAEDDNLQAAILSHLGITYAQLKQPEQAMHYYQEALQYEQAFSPLIRSTLFGRLAFSQAQLGREHEALASLDAARASLPDHPEDDPGSLFDDSGNTQVYTGWTYFELSKPHDPDELPKRNYLEQAWSAYRHITENPQKSGSERVHIEVINHQAATALALRNMEQFEKYFLLGANGAKALNSAKRKQEALLNWKAARKVWPQEGRIADLAEALM